MAVKIEWLNDEMTEAIVTRGWWRWQKQAHVARAPDCDAWFYVANGTLVEGAFADDYSGHTGLCWALDAHKRNTLHIRETLAKEEARRQLTTTKEAREVWQPVPRMPTARLVERKP